MLGKKGCIDSSRLHEMATPKDPHPTILSLLIQCMTTTPFCTCSCAYFRQQHPMKLTHYKLDIQLCSANCVDDGISGSRRYNGGRTLKRYEIGAPWKTTPWQPQKDAIYDDYNCHGYLKAVLARLLSFDASTALYHTLSLNHFDLAGPIDYHTLSK
jgi:hypothetical protein